MSPTEHDLRAALSDGEGDGPDPDRLIALAQASQARRRMQVLSTAVAVVLVAGAGTGIVALARSGGGSTKSADSATGGQAGERYAQSASGGAGNAGGGASAAVPAAGGASASRNADKAASAAVACPATLPRYALPGGGSPGQFGADEALFDRPVASVIVCAYDVAPAPSTAPLTPARTALSGASAQRLAASLNGAAAKPTAPCPKRNVTATARDFAIIGLAADGTPLHTVTVTRSASACADSQVTNGTAVRYNWTPPSDLLPILATLSPKTAPRMQGSPISS